jgi:hypothetical protein
MKTKLRLHFSLKSFVVNRFHRNVLQLGLVVMMFGLSNIAKAQIINEGFEESEWVTQAGSTTSTVTVNAVGTASINNGTWSYRSANVSTGIVNAGTKSLFIGSSSNGYIVTPMITSGITQVTVWVRANASSSTIIIGAATNTTVTANTGSVSSTAGGNAWASSTYGTAAGNPGGTLTSNAWAQLTFTTNITGSAFLKIQRLANNMYIDDIIVLGASTPTVTLNTAGYTSTYGNV